MAGPRLRPDCVPALAGVAARAEPVDGHHGLFPDNPGVMAAWQRRYISRAGDELVAVIHPDRQLPADVVLEVRRLTARGAGNRPHVFGPVGLSPRATPYRRENGWWYRP